MSMERTVNRGVYKDDDISQQLIEKDESADEMASTIKIKESGVTERC